MRDLSSRIFFSLKRKKASIFNKVLSCSQLRVVDIQLEKILLGGENDLPGTTYALMTGDLMRPSTRCIDGPHAQLLKEYRNTGEKILLNENLNTTNYYQNARDCIDYFGCYFPGIASDHEISLAAERFLRLADGRTVNHLPSDGHSTDGELIRVRAIKDSDCYQLIQGNHRLAFAHDRGDEFIKAYLIQDREETTPIQQLLSHVAWEQNEKVVYQPLPCPELEMVWKVARKCEDRMSLMQSFLEEHRLLNKGITYLDLGSYFGWFVAKMEAMGFCARGVERDYTAILIGAIAYKVNPASIKCMDIRRFLRQSQEQSDVVSCLSIMHHFITGRESNNPLDLLHLLDKATRKVLFFEMGGPHEQWFQTILHGWDDEFVKSWVLNNSSFKKAHFLGRDTDSAGDFAGNFGRSLFAFTK
jgi:hypothetical protein